MAYITFLLRFERNSRGTIVLTDGTPSIVGRHRNTVRIFRSLWTRTVQLKSFMSEWLWETLEFSSFWLIPLVERCCKSAAVSKTSTYWDGNWWPAWSALGCWFISAFGKASNPRRKCDISQQQFRLLSLLFYWSSHSLWKGLIGGCAIFSSQNLNCFSMPRWATLKKKPS